MNPQIALLLLAVVTAGLAVTIVLAHRRHGSPTVPPPAQLPSPAQTFSPLQHLRPGDIVLHQGRQLPVNGTVTVGRNNSTWQEHRLGGERNGWLTVERDGNRLRLTLLDDARPSDGPPDATELREDGTVYALVERGRAQFHTDGAVDTPPSGWLEYRDYADGAQRVSYERIADGPWVVARGRQILPGELQVVTVQQPSA